MGRLFWKIFLAFLCTLVVAVVGTGTAVWLQRHAEQRGERQLAIGPPHLLFTDMAASTLRHGGVNALKQWMADASRNRPLPLFAVNSAGVDLIGRSVPGAALARARELTLSKAETRGARLVTAPTGEQYLLFVPSGAEPRRPPPGSPPSPWILVFMGAIASVAVSAVLAWYLTRPIRYLRWAFNAAASGRLDTRVTPLMGRRRDEIADLGGDFDRMANQLQLLMSAQRRLLHDISHELRSPLARLQAAVGLVRQDPARLEPSLDRIEKESSRLDEMLGEVLTLARLESGSVGIGTETVDVADLVAAIAEDARFEAEVLKKKVAFHRNGDAAVRGCVDLLHRAAENVVRNAVKYTPAGTTVEISLRTQSDPSIVCITVTDAGPGIPAQGLEQVFEPFYRGSSRVTSDGFGLGLAIAHGAITAHGGTIAARNVPEGGLTVEIRLPMP
jgi:two-component system OmpR family sensor kinase